MVCLSHILFYLINQVLTLTKNTSLNDNAPINVKLQGGGRPGIGGVFDVRSLPVAGAFDHCRLWVGTFELNR